MAVSLVYSLPIQSQAGWWLALGFFTAGSDAYAAHYDLSFDRERLLALARQSDHLNCYTMVQDLWERLPDTHELHEYEPDAFQILCDLCASYYTIWEHDE